MPDARHPCCSARQLVEKLLEGFKEQWAPVMENIDIAEQVGGRVGWRHWPTVGAGPSWWRGRVGGAAQQRRQA